MRLTFDRGTLLLHDLPTGLQEGAVPGVRWDPRTRGHRAPAHLHRAITRAAQAAGIPMADETGPRGPVAAGWATVALRPYQEAALQAWERGGRHGVVVLPTGSGKTHVAIAAMARTGARTLCLVPTRVLLAQWINRLRELHLGEIGCLGDGERRVRPITVATYESAWRHMARLGDQFDLLVLDEAHHFGGGSRDEALEMCLAPLRLGLTATPATAPAAREASARLIGPIAFRLSLADLAGPFLSPFDVVTLPVELTPDERAGYDAACSVWRPVKAEFFADNPGADWVDFVREAGRSRRGRGALAAWRRSRQLTTLTEAKSAAVGALVSAHRSSRVIVFTGDNPAAYALAREHLIMPITCDIRRPERAWALEAFEQGALRALVSARVLNEGMDVPSADVAVIAGAGQGTREFVQRVGRVLRPAAGKRAVVYEVLCRGTHELYRFHERRSALATRSAA